MALVALHDRVGANQREPVLVILDLADIRLPPFYCVAALAVSPELTPVNVCMALSALGAYLLEDHAGVALRTCHLGVHSAQRIARGIMIEFRILPDRLPAHRGMAVLAGRGDRTMRIRHLRLRPRRLCLRHVCRYMHRQAAKCGGQSDSY